MKKIISISALIICCVLCMLIATSCDPSASIRENLKSSKTGDIIQFGKDEEGKAIDWVVYERSADSITAITVDFVETMPFDSHGKNSFNESTLGVWAREEFYNNSFTKAEKELCSSNSISLPNVYEIEDILSDDYINTEFRNNYTLSKDVCWGYSSVSMFSGTALFIPKEHEALIFEYDETRGINTMTKKTYSPYKWYLDNNNPLTNMSSTAQKYIALSEQEFYQNEAGVRLVIKINLKDSEN
ncbi:MAG: hypothetical protein IJJ15_06625 [Ruminococcus sp.]|nr:hypothetical protein [Ruminococcus sp.]